MTLVLAGIMWAIQLTIIPTLARDTAESWAHHVRTYRRGFRALFWPLVAIEGASGIAVALLQPAGIPLWLHGLNLVLLLGSWMTIPLSLLAVGHRPLARFHPEGFRTFARINWIRVSLWTARSAVVGGMLLLARTAGGR
jgi:hypothetical protein